MPAPSGSAIDLSCTAIDNAYPANYSVRHPHSEEIILCRLMLCKSTGAMPTSALTTHLLPSCTSWRRIYRSTAPDSAADSASAAHAPCCSTDGQSAPASRQSLTLRG